MEGAGYEGGECQNPALPPHPPVPGPFGLSPWLGQLAANLVGRERSGAPHPHVCLVVGEGKGLCSPLRSGLQDPYPHWTPSPPPCPFPTPHPGPESWLLLTIAGWAMQGAPGSAWLPSALPWDTGTYRRRQPRRNRLLPRGDKGAWRAGLCRRAVACLRSAVLRLECRGLFVPRLPAQNWGSPCKRLPSQTPPRTRPQPPSLWSPSAAGVVLVAAAAPMKF